jgi:hypothetical protein
MTDVPVPVAARFVDLRVLIFNGVHTGRPIVPTRD